ncbi:MAG: hypothetical protein JKY67_20940 [Pseudomonadales bacterium]|nr:hypothetical protein [Pseudomonadales bacterium]
MNPRVFTLENQTDHIDRIAARRLLFGQCVVHGAHAIVWVLDDWLSTIKKTHQISTLQVSFRKPIFLEREVKYRVANTKNKSDSYTLPCVAWSE